MHTPKPLTNRLDTQKLGRQIRRGMRQVVHTLMLLHLKHACRYISYVSPDTSM